MVAGWQKWGCAKMVIIKYSKLGLGAFIGEEEMFDCWSRVMNRSGIEFNKGDFNHKLFLPAPIGVESKKEYLLLNTLLDEDKVKLKIQELFPDWIEVNGAYFVNDLT